MSQMAHKHNVQVCMQRTSCIAIPASALCQSIILVVSHVRRTGHSDEERGHLRGSDIGRSDSGEIEMTDFERPGLPRQSSASMLDDLAGTRAGKSSAAKSPLSESVIGERDLSAYSRLRHVMSTA